MPAATPAGPAGIDAYATGSLLVALLLGTMGLPHVLVRFYTSPDGVSARRTTVFVIVMVSAFYAVSSAMGLISRVVAPDLAEPGAAATVALAVGGPQPNHAPCGQRAVLDDAPQECLRVVEQLAGFLAAQGVGQDVGVDALHLPGDEKRRPVDVVQQSGNGLLDDLAAWFLWSHRRDGVQTRCPFAGLLDGNEAHVALAVAFAQGIVFGAGLFAVGGLVG